MELNSKGEVADFQDENQFSGGKTAYACVAFSAALLKYMGQPGHGPAGNGMDIATLAYYWYGKLEGSSDASNTNGMSLSDEYTMLKGIGLTYEPLEASVAAVKSAVSAGKPVLFCGSEVGMHDVALGDAVPYSWQPSGNHAIVISGIASDGNLLVHDCASIAPTGVRPGPRVYDASKLQPVSATAIVPAWLTEEDMIDINSPGVGNYFTENDAHHWSCKQTGKTLQYGVLDFYKAENGLKRLGLPVSNEIVLSTGGQETRQHFERGVVFFDPQHKFDNPPGAGSVYYAHVYSGPAWTAVTSDFTSQIATLTQQLQTATHNDTALQAVKAIIPIVKPFE